MTTINKTISHGITIGATYSSPLTITAPGYVGGITGNSVATVVNAGRISGGNPSSGAGVTLAAGGSVTNQAGGVISGGRYGILTDAASTVVNAGSIGGNATIGIGVYLEAGGSVSNQSGGTISGQDGIFAAAASTVVNAGSIGGNATSGIGVYLKAGGSVSNQSGGTISGRYGIVASAATTVVNAGSIGGNATSGLGVYLFGGSVTNQAGGTISGGVDAVKFLGGDTGRLVIDPGAVFVGTVDGGNTIGAATLSTLELGSGPGAGTLTGLGSRYVHFGAITIDSGAAWTLAADTIGTGYTIADNGTLTNTGSIGSAVTLGAGAVLTNQAGGTISSNLGILAAAASTVVNAGSIGGNAASGVGILLQAGGSVSNQAGGVISGYYGISANKVTTVVNAGSIGGNATSGIGVYLRAGGSVTNQAGGTISGGADAVKFHAGYTGRLVIDPGAVFVGTVEGGIGAATLSTLELGSGTGAGTLTGLGSRYVDFAAITIDSGATWTLAAATIGTGYRIADNGTLTNTGSIGSAVTLGAGAVLTNASGATIAGNPSSGAGVTLTASGSVTNQAGGTISGHFGISANNVTTVVNAGSIGGNATSGIGVYLEVGGSVSNQAGGTISGRFGIEADAALTVVNAGSIEAEGSGTGIILFAAGSITNQSDGAISGQYFGIDGFAVTTVVNAGSIGGNATSGLGVYLFDGGSVTNQAGGTISGGADAVTFRAGYTGRLVIDPGAVFVGTVDGGNTIGATTVSTLELASGAGTLSGIGTQFINFGSIAFDQGADWFIEGDAAGLGGTISGFAAGDTIEIDGITVTGSSYADGVLTLTDTSGSVSLDLAGDFTTNEFVVTNVTGGAEVTALCFCTNTLIETPDGARKVQDLAAGDLVVTFGGAVRPISWVGTGAVLATRGRRSAATPVIVHKGALADNVPYRDLRVTKGHSFLIDDVLIPVEFLVNHRSIAWDDRAQEVKLYHVELETHDVLVANGAPAESYRDDGNRWLFQNANSGWGQPPKPPCAPVLTGGPVVDAAWRRLLDRCGPRVPVPLTDEPDLHLVVDGQRLDATGRHGGRYVFRLAEQPGSVRIGSRSVVPQELGLGRDSRSLGVALRHIAVRQGTRLCHAVKADDVRLADGFHLFEKDEDFVWTDGDAVLPLDLLAGCAAPVDIVLTVASTTRYIDKGVRQGVA